MMQNKLGVFYIGSCTLLVASPTMIRQISSIALCGVVIEIMTDNPHNKLVYA